MAFPAATRPVRIWLLSCLFLVAAMVLIGGATRLTESGLSIVKWKLVSGILPPIGEMAWQAEFEAYRTSPQYQQVNRGFSLEDFQRIYWLEYLHRLLGRLTALTFLLPLCYFAARRQMGSKLTKRMFIAFLLIAAQGGVGWVMVASGLVDQPRVNPLKLGLHLSLAFGLFALLLWTYWQVTHVERPPTSRSFARAAQLLLALVAVQVFLGALVAGLRAGLTYNTWPLMDGQFIPDGLHLMRPWWRNHLESVLTVQFQHRMMAYIVLAAILAFVAAGWRRLSHHRRQLGALLIAVLFQFFLGVATLLSDTALGIALAHQMGALLLLGITLRLTYLLPLNTGGMKAKIA